MCKKTTFTLSFQVTWPLTFWSQYYIRIQLCKGQLHYKIYFYVPVLSKQKEYCSQMNKSHNDAFPLVKCIYDV